MNVFDEAHDYIAEVFRGFSVPIDASTCPFHKSNLDFFKSMHHIADFRRAETKHKFECFSCNKQFKSIDYLEYHLKTMHQHPLDEANVSAGYLLGSQEVS